MVYTICGKTSSGKDSVLRELTKRGYKRIVSYTTRPPREGDVMVEIIISAQKMT